MSYRSLHGDVMAMLKTLADNSVDAIATDPPYHLTTGKKGGTGPASVDLESPYGRARVTTGFMGMKWDGGDIAYSVPMWKECLRVLKPGGYLLSFGGSRTYHRMACAVEDAGFEIRDQIQWVFGSGFPKSMDVSKKLDESKKNEWINISKACDKIQEWIENSSLAKCAELLSQKSETAIGMSTTKSDSAPEVATAQARVEKLLLPAIIAELKLSDLHPTPTKKPSSVRGFADTFTLQSNDHAKYAGNYAENQDATSMEIIFTVQCDAKELLNERMVETIKGDGHLTTLLGKKQLSSVMEENVACVVLLDVWKHIILSQSKTFLNCDTTLQMECVSAMIVTITKSTAESLILFTVDTLKNKAIKKSFEAEGSFGGPKSIAHAGWIDRGRMRGEEGHEGYQRPWMEDSEAVTKNASVYIPGSEKAKEFSGWGTALKPAHEPIVVARKPLIGTVAANILEHGTGALNITACRIPGEPVPINKLESWSGFGQEKQPEYTATMSDVGRWPSNFIHDGSDEVIEQFPIDDSGSAARFFYCAKASKEDRGEGNNHPTVKPTDLMRYLCKMITPPGGTVLDPFMGSGSTGKAALYEGFNFIGIEKEAEYCAIAKARMEYVLATDVPLLRAMEASEQPTVVEVPQVTQEIFNF